MQIWLDTIDETAICDGVKTGIISGVTTNSSILSKAGNVQATLRNLLELQPGFLAVQVVSVDPEKIVEEGQRLYDFSSRIIVKVPVNRNGLIAMKQLRAQGIPFMGTAVLFPTQVLLASNLGATYVAPYLHHMGNHGDACANLMVMGEILRQNGSTTKILVASLRELDQIVYCAQIGVEAVTIKAELYYQLVADQAAVESFVQKFLSDWNEFQGRRILES